MAKKDKDAPGIDAQREQEEKEARKKLKAAEKAKPADDKDKPAKKAGGKRGKKAARWLRDFRGETKKIVWPDFKTVIKNTGIVLLTVVIIGALVWVVDFVLTSSIRLMKEAAAGAAITQETTVPDSGLEEETEAPEVNTDDFEAPTAPAAETTAPAAETTAAAEQ